MADVGGMWEGGSESWRTGARLSERQAAEAPGPTEAAAEAARSALTGHKAAVELPPDPPHCFSLWEDPEPHTQRAVCAIKKMAAPRMPFFR